MATTTVREDVTTRNGAVQRLTAQVRAEYAEMPGLSLTLAQAQRLWTADPATCAETLASAHADAATPF